MATTIDTRANLKIRLGITGATDDDLLDKLMESADKAITAHVGGRTFPAAATSITEYHHGNQYMLQVRRPPIDSITSIKVDSAYGWGSGITALVANTDYIIRSASAGIVQCLFGNWQPAAAAQLKALDGLPRWTDHPGIVRIIYTGDGPANDDVKQAFALLVLHYYTIAKTEVAASFKRLAFTSDGTTQIQRNQASANLDQAGMPAIVIAMLAPYRIRPL